MCVVSEFLRFFDEITRRYPMRMELTYSRGTDWTINIWRKGTGDDGKDERILLLQDCDLDYVMAKAQVILKDWLSDNVGGY